MHLLSASLNNSNSQLQQHFPCCLIAEDARQRIQQLFSAAAAKGMQRAALMALAVASMTPQSADEAMQEDDKLLVSYSYIAFTCWWLFCSVQHS